MTCRTSCCPRSRGRKGGRSDALRVKIIVFRAVYHTAQEYNSSEYTSAQKAKSDPYPLSTAHTPPYTGTHAASPATLTQAGSQPVHVHVVACGGGRGATKGDWATPRLARMRPPRARRGEHYIQRRCTSLVERHSTAGDRARAPRVSASARLAEEREAAALDAPARRRGRLAAAARVAECGVKDEAGPLEWRSAVVARTCRRAAPPRAA